MTGPGGLAERRLPRFWPPTIDRGAGVVVSEGWRVGRHEELSTSTRVQRPRTACPLDERLREERWAVVPSLLLEKAVAGPPMSWRPSVRLPADSVGEASDVPDRRSPIATEERN
jgi:hypothetical protein